MPKPKLLSSAWEDLADIADYLVRIAGENTAKATTDAILDTIDLLENMPYLEPVHHDPVLQTLGYRKLVVGRYVCVYRIIDSVPTVYDIFHERQDYAWRLTEKD